MSEEEIEKALDEIFKEDTQTIRESMKSLIRSYDNALGELVESGKKINELQKENAELKEENQKINKAADKENVTMRWIDILNRIAGNQKVPHKIRYKLMIPKYQVMVYDSEEQEYRFENDMNEFVEISNHHLNDEVEIIEEGD